MIVAGAGIGGLTAALALARNGFGVVVLEQAERLEETGAGIQLSPNASRALIDLGLESELRPSAVAPRALHILDAANGREIVRLPLDEAAARYGAPYWMIHRGDLQAALLAAVSKHREITLKLGARVLDFVAHPDDITVTANGQAGKTEDRGVALLAADGLWSTIRARIGDAKPPRFAGRTAWRALVPAAAVAPEFRQPAVHLWLGRDTHLVHYPVRAGGLINIVAITADRWDAPGWSEPAAAADLVPRFASAGWAAPALSLLEVPDAWLKWGLYDRSPLSHWSHGRAALLGDAAHAMLPYLAQGAAMAIEDAVVAAQCLVRQPDDAAKALGVYCIARRARTGRVQRLAARNGARYHLVGAGGRLRNAAMRMLGGERLLRHYDWLYGWQADGPPEAPPRSRTDRNI